MDLVNILSTLAGNDTVNEISNKFNIDTNKVSSVIKNALPTLIGAMQKNASTEGGAATLAKALGDHAGNENSMISNLKNVDLTDGSKILSKILGSNASFIFEGIGKQTGTTGLQVNNILSSIAPAMMNMLGKLKGNNNTGNDGLGALLGSVLGGGASSNAGGGSGNILGGLGKIFGGK